MKTWPERQPPLFVHYCICLSLLAMLSSQIQAISFGPKSALSIWITNHLIKFRPLKCFLYRIGEGLSKLALESRGNSQFIITKTLNKHCGKKPEYLLLSDKVRTAPSLLVLLLWAIPSRLFLHSDNNLIINTGSWLFHFMPFKSWDGGYESFLCRVNLLLWILFEWNPQQQLKPNTLTSGFLHFIWTG